MSTTSKFELLNLARTKVTKAKESYAAAKEALHASYGSKNYTRSTRLKLTERANEARVKMIEARTEYYNLKNS